MNLICFDTCIEEVSLTLLNENSFFCEKKWPRFFQGGSANFLVPALAQLCIDAKFPLHQLDGIGVTRGPGSFTGIRLGLSIAQGLRLAFQKPIFAVTLFDLWKAHAQTLFPHRPLWIIVNTYGAFWAIQPYHSDGSLGGEAFLLPPDSLGEEIEKRENQESALVLVGWNVRGRILSHTTSLRVYDLAEAQLNNAALLAQYILHNRATIHPEKNPAPYYLKSPSFVKQL